MNVLCFSIIFCHNAFSFHHYPRRFNNPTGRCISVARKQQLLAITRAHGLPVVSDEVYQMLDASNHLQAPSSSSSSWSRLPPLRSLLSLLDLPEVDDTGNEDSAHSRRPDNVLVVSSFSKILAPGLRGMDNITLSLGGILPALCTG